MTGRSTLGLILLLALALRLAAAAGAGPMNDEAFTRHLSSRPLGEIATGARPDNNPPGYYLLLHPLSSLTHDPFILRLPSVLLGIGAVAFTFLAGREILGSGLPGLAMACAYPVWLADSQVRQYGLLACAASAALWLAARGLRHPLSRKALAGYGVACAAAPLASYGGFLLLAGLFLGALQPGPSRRPLLGATALAALPGLAWLGYALSSPTRSDLLRSSFAPPSAADPLAVPAYLTGLTLPAWWPWTRAEWGGAGDAAGAILGLALFGVMAWGVDRLRRRGRSPEALLLCTFLGLPLAAALAMGLVGMQPFQPRYLVPGAASVFILLFAGLGRLGPSFAALVVAVNLLTAAAFPSDPFLWNQDWPGAARWIQERQGPGDVMAVCLPYSLLGLDYSYAPKTVSVHFSVSGAMQVQYAAGYEGIPQVPLAKAPPGEKPGPGRVFLVLCPAGDPELRPLIGWFNERYHVVDAREQASLHGWGRIAVYLLEPRS